LAFIKNKKLRADRWVLTAWVVEGPSFRNPL